MFEFVKVSDVKSPERGTSGSAGIDFFIPNDFNGCWLDPGKSILIPSGIHVKFPKEKVLIFFNKSGIASKLGLDVMACVIDSDYEGQVHINLVNTHNSNPVRLEPGMKIVQGILLDCDFSQPTESKLSLEDFYANSNSERGDGGFGSTDKISEVVEEMKYKKKTNKTK